MSNFIFRIIIWPISILVHWLLKIEYIQTLSTIKVHVDSTLGLTVLITRTNWCTYQSDNSFYQPLIRQNWHLLPQEAEPTDRNTFHIDESMFYLLCQFCLMHLIYFQPALSNSRGHYIWMWPIQSFSLKNKTPLHCSPSHFSLDAPQHVCAWEEEPHHAPHAHCHGYPHLSTWHPAYASNAHGTVWCHQFSPCYS